MAIQKFRKKPLVIEAIQFDGTAECEEQLRAAFHHPVKVWFDRSGTHLVIPTLEGDMTAQPGDWIIRGVKGEIYPCPDDIFRATYEVADDDIVVPF